MQPVGKLKHDIDVKIILSTGAYLPRDVPCRFLKDRIDEWHRHNPGQLASACLSYSMMLSATQISQTASVSPVPSYAHSQASIDARIAEIQAEIASLRAQNSDAANTLNSRAELEYTQPVTSCLDRSSAQSSRVAEFPC